MKIIIEFLNENQGFVTVCCVAILCCITGLIIFSRSTNKHGKIIENSLLLLSFAFSSIAVCRTYPSNVNFDNNYNSIFVSILSVLVTILLGWQIWKSVEWTQKMEKMEHIARSIAPLLAKRAKIKQYIDAGHSHATRNVSVYAVECYITAINMSLEPDCRDLTNESVEKLYSFSVSWGTYELKIHRGKKETYIEILNKVDEGIEHIKEVIGRIQNAHETDRPEPLSREELLNV